MTLLGACLVGVSFTRRRGNRTAIALVLVTLIVLLPGCGGGNSGAGDGGGKSGTRYHIAQSHESNGGLPSPELVCQWNELPEHLDSYV